MPANTAPVFPNVGVAGFSTLATANTALDGTGTVATLATASTNGMRCDMVKIKHLGTNVATVVRIFINNGSANTTASNNALLAELTIAANTVSQTAQSLETYVIDLAGIVVPSGYKINATIGTTVAAGLAVTFTGGQL